MEEISGKMERRNGRMCGPLIDWNGNGRIDPSDIGISLAIAEEELFDEEDWQNDSDGPESRKK